MGSKHKHEHKREVKFLFLMRRSFQVSKKSSWEFVGELSNTTCVLNCEKQGHEKK